MKIPLEKPCFRDPRQTLWHIHSIHTPKEYSLVQWEKKAKRLKAQIYFAAGLFGWHEKKIEAILLDGQEIEGVWVEKLVLRRENGFCITGNLYRPLAKGCYPAVLQPHGHWDEGRLTRDTLVDVPGRCLAFAQNGFVALSYDMIGFGDSSQLNHDFSSEESVAYGVNTLGEQLKNSIRCLDFLESLDFVDKTKIGCTGASGGATQSFLLAAIDPRVVAIAPVNMVSHCMQGGCCCENAAGLRFDTNNVELAALCAPRPIFLTGCSGDWTATMERLELPAMKNIYALYGKADLVEHFYCQSDHNYNKATREAVVNWFIRLWGHGRAFMEPVYEVDIEKLRITALPAGAVMGKTLLTAMTAGAKAQSIRFTADATLSQLKTGLCCATGVWPEQIVEMEKDEKNGIVEHSLRGETGRCVQIYTLQGSGSGSVLVVSTKGLEIEAAPLLALYERVYILKNLLLPYLGFAGGRRPNQIEDFDWSRGESLICYNPSDTALWVADVFLALTYLNKKDIDVYGMETLGAAALCAAALYGRVKTMWISPSRLNVPAIDSVGGMNSILRLCKEENISVRSLWL